VHAWSTSLPIHFSNSPSQRSAAPFLCGAGCAVVFGKIRIARKKNRGRAGRQGSNWTRGPRRLATSRLVEVLCASPSALVRTVGKACRKSAKPRASRARCFRFAPHPPRWSAPPREGETCCVTLHRLWAQALGGTPVTGALSAYRPSRPPACGSARQKRRGLDRRALAPHLRCKVMSRPPLPAPRLETLIRRPSVTGRDNS
jgi:hypothetical protein